MELNNIVKFCFKVFVGGWVILVVIVNFLSEINISYFWMSDLSFLIDYVEIIFCKVFL